MIENTINDDVTMTGRASVLASRYRIVRQLGSGGMGSVWLAEDMQLDGKLFAIKMLPSILVANKRAYQQLKSEALVSMRLTHPNIVTLRSFEENNGNPFLVMDYIDGETLDDWLGDRGQESGGRSQVSEEEVVRLLKPIAEALDYAHGEGVIHRDIKPANVMIRKDGRPFVMDFGIAREIQETMTRVTGKMSSGTLLYMSPEQLNGDMPKKEQDIYSFAAMVYECIKGEPPFCRGAIEDQIKHKEPEPLVGRVVLNAPNGGGLGTDRPTITESVMRGLAKKPEDRPKSCVEVLETKFNRVERVDCVELGNEIPLEDFPYLPSDMRMRKGITATQSQSGENAELSKSHVEDHARSSGIIEKQAASTEARKSLFGFWTIVVVLLMVIVLAGSLWKFYDSRQTRIQQEERQKIVAEQKRLAMEARLGASMAQKEAEKNDAKKLAVEEYDAAIMMKGLADNAWSVLHYETAKNRFLNARDLFAKSVKVAQRNKGRQNTYQSKSEQQEVKTERQEVKNIKPELRVNAMLLGNNVHGAKINDGVRDHITPIRWTLEYGKTYGPYKVTYEKNGRKYSGKLDAVKVDWLGAREKSVVLTEDVDFSLIEKTENTSKAIEAFNAKRYDEAYRLFLKSDLENKEVQYFLGRMYAYGQGVQKNEYEAVKWYRRAAE
ncbi:MAG: protein kinase, partial [Kiritimatiellae bacterium]|nr:protein kinase [Kiritimatiellia bacterium]